MSPDFEIVALPVIVAAAIPSAGIAVPPLEIAMIYAAIQTVLIIVPAAWISMAYAAAPLHGRNDDAWYERARLGWPLQEVYAFAFRVGLGLAVAWQWFQWRRDHSDDYGIAASWTAFVVGVVLMEYVGWPTAWNLEGAALTTNKGMKRIAFILLSEWYHLVIVVVAWQSAPPEFNARVVLHYAAALGVASTLYFGGALALLRLLRVIVPASEKTRAVINAAAARCGFAVPTTYELDISSANAYAFPVGGQIGVGRVLVEELQPDELEAILLHEVGHLQESWAEIMQRWAVLPLSMSVVFFDALEHQFGFAGLLVYVPVIYGINRLSTNARRQEEVADEFARRCVGSQADYARALEKIHRINLVPAVLGRFSDTHPDLYDRMLAAGVTPSYDRPEQPNRRRTIVAITLFGVLCVAALVISEVAAFTDFRKSVSPATTHQQTLMPR